MIKGFIRPPHLRQRLVLTAALSLLLLLFATPASADPPSPLNPFSPTSGAIANLFYLVLAIALMVFVVVEALIIISVLRYRRRAEGGPEPVEVHGHTALELTWTAIPALILAVLFVLTFQALQAAQNPPGDALRVQVVGHQWWWQFNYPDQGVTTANQLVVPVGQPILFSVTSADVIHSFWVPQLGGKIDVIPGQENTYWFEVEEPGDYHGQCAEFCGLGHPFMPIRLTAVTEEEFAVWVMEQLAGSSPPSEDLLAQGKVIVESGVCAVCHTISGTLAQGKKGPDLTWFGRRPFIGGILENNPQNLALWLDDPPAVKEGALMPDYGLSEEDIRALVAYLESLK
ncbi:MAG: cytochrome c oxidase subunit II [Chloroflexi bacterium]|nr:cytochrome c oxidase subunit II [Chloroflexota bacterium]